MVLWKISVALCPKFRPWIKVSACIIVGCDVKCCCNAGGGISLTSVIRHREKEWKLLLLFLVLLWLCTLNLLSIHQPPRAVNNQIK
jgi:hypothetical protein